MKTIQRRQGVEQASAPPIKDMIVGQHAAVGRDGHKAIRVLRAHSIIDAFRGKVLAASYACFEIDDASIWTCTIQLI